MLYFLLFVFELKTGPVGGRDGREEARGLAPFAGVELGANDAHAAGPAAEHRVAGAHRPGEYIYSKVYEYIHIEVYLKYICI